MFMMLISFHRGGGGGMILMKRCLLSLDDGSDEEGTAMLVLSLKLERNHLLFSSVCYLV
jgi:hypothetical protein